MSIIVARAANGVIGRDGGLPWRLSGDMAFFKKTTLGAPVVMGRRTWESLPIKPLPKRDNIVVSRDWAYAAEGARVYSSLATALSAGRAMAARSGRDEVFVIGGEAVYRRALGVADRLYLTDVDAAPEGDATFPAIDPADWRLVDSDPRAADEKNDHAFVLNTYERVA
ncbi:MAG: dihydrofolate reductase [Pseudomonadota bacterium]